MVLFSNEGTVWPVGLVIHKKKGAIPKNPPFCKSIMSDGTIWSWHTEPNMVAGLARYTLKCMCQIGRRQGRALSS
jgi:hypothetical protein